jgi:hypothetical protein
MNTNGFIWLLSHNEVNLHLSPGVAAAELIVQPPWLKEGLQDRDCRGLVVDLDSVAPGRLALQRLVNELMARSHPYPVAVFGYSLEEDQVLDLRAAGIHVFQHCLCPEVFAAIAKSIPMNSNGFVWLLSHDEVNQYLAPSLAAPFGFDVQMRFLKEGLPGGDYRVLVVDPDNAVPGRLALQRSSRN